MLIYIVSESINIYLMPLVCKVLSSLGELQCPHP
jgi:hypothetical protein